MWSGKVTIPVQKERIRDKKVQTPCLSLVNVREKDHCVKTDSTLAEN